MSKSRDFIDSSPRGSLFLEDLIWFILYYLYCCYLSFSSFLRLALFFQLEIQLPMKLPSFAFSVLVIFTSLGESRSFYILEIASDRGSISFSSF